MCNGALWRPGDGDKAGTLVRADAPLRPPLGVAKGGVDGHGGGRVAALCAECIADGGNVLVFCPTIKDAREVAARLAALFGDAGAAAAARLPFPSREVSDDRARMLDELRELHPKGEVSDDLGRGVPLGVGVHHGKMTDEEKEVVEAAYRRKAIAVLVCTSTLAAGVNLPARRVLILKPAAWYNAGGNSGWLATDKYRQMTGRAGRANLSAVGESFLLLDSSNKKLDEKQAVERDILSKAASPLLSRLVAPCTRRGENLRRFLLDAIASRACDCRRTLLECVGCTLAHAQAADGGASLAADVEKQLRWLVDKELVVRGAPPAAAPAAAAAVAADAAESLAPTELGEAVYLSALSPDEALEVHAELLAYQRCAFLETDIHLVYVLTPRINGTGGFRLEKEWKLGQKPDGSYDGANGADERQFERYAAWYKAAPEKTQRLAVKLRLTPDDAGGGHAPSWLQGKHFRFRAAFALNRLAHGAAEHEVAKEFGVERGDMQALVEAIGRQTVQLRAFCENLRWPALAALLLRQHERVEFGGRPELNALLEIKHVKLARAKALYKAGLADLPRLAAASDDAVLAVLRQLPHSREGAKGLPRIAKAIVKDAKRVAKRKLHEISDEIAHGVHAGDGGAPPGVVIAARGGRSRAGGAERDAPVEVKPVSPRTAHDWSTFLRLAAEAPVVGFAAGWRRDGALGGVAIALEVDRRPPIVWWVPLSDAAADDDGADTTLEGLRRVLGRAAQPKACFGGDAHVEAIVAAGVAVSPPVYDPMHAAALLQPHIDAPPKLSELLTLRSAMHAALARCDGGRTAHESGCVHAARSLAACCELLPAVAEQGLTAPLKASLTPALPRAAAARPRRDHPPLRRRVRRPPPAGRLRRARTPRRRQRRRGRRRAAAPLSDRLRTRGPRAAGRRAGRAAPPIRRARPKRTRSPRRRRRRWRWRRGGGEALPDSQDSWEADAIAAAEAAERARFGGSVSGAPPDSQATIVDEPMPAAAASLPLWRARARVRRRAGGARAAEHPTAGDRPAPPRAPRGRRCPARRRVRRAARDVRQADRRGRCGRRWHERRRRRRGAG